MKKGVLIDSETRKYVGDYLDGMDVSEGLGVVYDIPPDGLYDPIYEVGTGWKNGLTQEEIDALQPPQVETDAEKIERLEQTQADIILQLLMLEMGGIA